MITAPAYSTTSDDLLHPARGKTPADFFVGWGTADFADTPLFCAELCRLAYGDEPLVRACLARVGLDLVKWLGGPRLEQRVQSWGTDGFIAVAGDGRTFMVFRGTEGDRIEDVVADLRTDDCAWATGGRVHEGFAAAFDAVAAELDTALAGRSGSLILAGHSLGAAIATLAASMYRQRAPELFTYGSPRVGDGDFVATLAGVQHRRHVHCCDVVPRVPPECFDVGNVRMIVEPFGGDGFLAQITEATLANILKLALGDPRFEHHGAPVYLSQDRTVLESPAQRAMDADQAAARQDYSQLTAADLSSAAGDGPHVDFLPSFRRLLSLGTAGPQLAFRDLADHAPINYLGVLAARRADVPPE